jgi:hypothetical protein
MNLSVTGWWFGTFGLFFHILGMSSSQLTIWYFETTNQVIINVAWIPPEDQWGET